MTIFNDPVIDQACQGIGEQFHQELAEKLGQAPPDTDPLLNEQIGQALRLAIDYQAPALAIELYNRWAVPRGLEIIIYMGTVLAPDYTQSVMLNVGVAIIRVDRFYHIEDLHDLRADLQAAH